MSKHSTHDTGLIIPISITFLGYFTHVTTLGEVKEQVLKYIPVMARPMVMYRDKHPIVWTGVYADIEVSLSLEKFFRITLKKIQVPDESPIWMIKLPKPMRESEIFGKEVRG